MRALRKKLMLVNRSARAQVKVNAYLEGIGVLVKRGLIEPSLVDDLMSSIVVGYWEKYRPYLLETRVRRNQSMMGEYIEFLYGQIKPIVESQHPELRKMSP
jgi:hypothetical protein